MGKITKMNIRRDYFTLTYALIIGLVAVVLFLSGFFPIKYHDNNIASNVDIPDHVKHIRIRMDELYKPSVKKIVFMIIDALRWDFVTGHFGSLAMPFTAELIRKNVSCLMQAKSDPPTVTMPRIKAMMTGSVSSFVDIALNFGDSPILGDSFLLQANKHGHRINFYGDDTWLKIFPKMFKRYEGTNSFFVNDFTEVDNNVTRNLAIELEKDDWSMLILHYLGLDHIGHVHGPFGSPIKPKLKEMDEIISQIYKQIHHWNKNGLPALFVVCGDHGMKDSGGHGGSTPEETLVPFLVIGAHCPSKPIHEPHRISQVDVASILSVMLGTSIPASNIGSVPPVLLNGRSDSSKLFILYYNAQQVLKYFKAVPDYESSQAYKYYEDAVKLHVHWLSSNQEGSKIVEEALTMYDAAFENMKELLIRSTIDYDLHTMTIAIIFMGHVAHIIANGEIYETRGLLKKLCWIFGSIISYIILRFIWEFENVTLPKLKSFLLNIFSLGLVVSNSNIAGNISLIKSTKNQISSLYGKKGLFILGMFAYVASLTSTSFIEEEHQIWYFFWATLLILLFLEVVRNNLSPKLGIEIMLSLILHRVLRKLNSTGNKYAHLPDIGNFLKNQEDNTAVTILLIVALGLMVCIGYVCEHRKYRVITSTLQTGAFICVYLRHMVTGSVAKLPLPFNSNGVFVVRIFWIITMLYILFWVYRLFRTRVTFLASQFFLAVLESWILISSILHRPHNVILLPMQILVSRVMHDIVRANKSGEDIILYVYLWMGNVFYFYQGNSNSLATIDVAAGFVGMETYQPLMAGIFLSINTYSAPVLAYLILIYRSTVSEKSKCYMRKILSINRRCALWRFLPLAIYSIIVTIQRFHLFVWTVFSPKVLYEAMYCGVMFTFILIMQTVCFYASPK
ncbi:GPI ethanolamine phosphate transferase 2 [Venturia canescens]|uniref:GPI ethanolamine phosphate transferase 2 n=1 Tax=Venturia canescens TaxID=32260 RepID=UPI001C9C1591|nr:GPI ethanolamine phosphate transferase 2 [Venturia canescens]